jgi:hypothetical protein
VTINWEIDNYVAQGGKTILSSARGPRRYGILSCNKSGYIGAGSVTAWREAQKEARRKHREKHGIPAPKPPAKKSVAEKIFTSAGYEYEE